MIRALSAERLTFWACEGFIYSGLQNSNVDGLNRRSRASVDQPGIIVAALMNQKKLNYQL